MARLAAAQWGVLSLDDLHACGLSPTAIADRVRSGHLHRLHRGVYAVGHANPPLEGRFLGAVKAAGTGAVLSHLSAAALWEIVPWERRHPEVTVPRAGRRAHSAIRIHRSSMLTAADVTRHRGIPVTTAARTLIDLAATLEEKPLRRAVRRAQGLHRTNLRQIAGALNRSGRRHGTAKLARIIATGPAPTRTEIEDIVLDLMLHSGLARPDVNRPMLVAGRRVVPDFRWPAERLIVEADSAAWHDDPLARDDDAERQALLEAHGERVVRVTWQQATTRPAQTIERLRRAGAPGG